MTQRLTEQTLQIKVEKKPIKEGKKGGDVVWTKQTTVIHGRHGAVGTEKGEKQPITLGSRYV